MEWIPSLGSCVLGSSVQVAETKYLYVPFQYQLQMHVLLDRVW